MNDHDGTSSPANHAIPTRRFHSDGRSIWYIDRLWCLADGLPVVDLPISAVRELDEVCWFSARWGRHPTCRAVFEHCQRMLAADLAYPVILGPDGSVLDGLHRIGKAMSLGHDTVRAVRLEAMPPADETIPPDDPRYEVTECR